MTTLQQLEEALLKTDELMIINKELHLKNTFATPGYSEIYDIRKFIAASLRDLRHLY